jgi:hypothetical protein
VAPAEDLRELLLGLWLLFLLVLCLFQVPAAVVLVDLL